MTDTILVATDGSENSQKAVEKAVDLAAQLGASLHAISVTPQYPSERPGGSGSSDQRGEAAIEAAREAAERADVEFEGSVQTGLPHEEIIEFISHNDVDMLVMGTHSRTGLKRMVIGSVAEKTVRNSPIPVLTVPAEK